MKATTANGAEPSAVVWRVDVVVMPKPGVNDPEGEAILGGLHSLGYGEAHRVRAGRIYALEIEAEDEASARRRAEEMADRLPANPVIQVFHIQAVTAVEGARIS